MRDKITEIMARTKLRTTIYKDASELEDEHWQWYLSNRNDPQSLVHHSTQAREHERANETLAATEAAGFAVAPVEPTEAMMNAGMETSPMTQLRGTGWRLSLSTEHCAEIYRAMLAAAGGIDGKSR